MIMRVYLQCSLYFLQQSAAQCASLEAGDAAREAQGAGPDPYAATQIPESGQRGPPSETCRMTPETVQYI